MCQGQEVCFELAGRQVDALLQHRVEIDFKGFQIAGGSTVKIGHRLIVKENGEHAAKFAELLGEVVTDSTEKNLAMRVEAENGATAGKNDLAARAKALGLDAIHDTVHETGRDEARHGKAFAGLLKRYFGK